MTDAPKMNNDELITAGLKCLDEALSHFAEVTDDVHIDAVAKTIHSTIVLAEMAYNFYRKI